MISSIRRYTIFRRSVTIKNTKDIYYSFHSLSKLHNVQENKSEEDIHVSKGAKNNTLPIFIGVGLAGGLSYYFYSSKNSTEKIVKDEAIIKKENKIKSIGELKDIKPISEDQANLILNKNQSTHLINIKPNEEEVIKGIRVYSNHLQCNQEMEDRFFIANKVENGQFLLGVFDGHVGYHCSEFLSKKLPETYKNEIFSHINTFNTSLEKDAIQKIESKIKKTFLSIDEYLLNIHTRKGASLTADDLLPTINGSCANLVSIDIKNGHLFASNVGDCRAVLGSLDEKGKWISIPLSKDHTLSNPEEATRLCKEHPGEEKSLTENNRVLGKLMPSRTFGDAFIKWDIDTLKNVYHKLVPNHIPIFDNYLTPPYVTAEPEVHYHKLEPNKDKFIVLATDGLFDELTSQQVVELVGNHLNNLSSSKQDNSTFRETDVNTFTFVDENLATHLIRNALGAYPIPEEVDSKTLGKVPPILKLLAMKPPNARNYRDDITVLVMVLES